MTYSRKDIKSEIKLNGQQVEIATCCNVDSVVYFVLQTLDCKKVDGCFTDKTLIQAIRNKDIQIMNAIDDNGVLKLF